MQELRRTAGRLCERGLAGACYASIISTIEIQLSLSPHQTAMPRHEVWASDNLATMANLERCVRHHNSTGNDLVISNYLIAASHAPPQPVRLSQPFATTALRVRHNKSAEIISVYIYICPTNSLISLTEFSIACFSNVG